MTERLGCVLEDFYRAREGEPDAIEGMHARINQGVIAENSGKLVLDCEKCGANFTLKGNQQLPGVYGCALWLTTPYPDPEDPSLCEGMPEVITDTKYGGNWIMKLGGGWFNLGALDEAPRQAIFSPEISDE